MWLCQARTQELRYEIIRAEEVYGDQTDYELGSRAPTYCKHSIIWTQIAAVLQLVAKLHLRRRLLHLLSTSCPLARCGHAPKYTRTYYSPESLARDGTEGDWDQVQDWELH